MQARAEGEAAKRKYAAVAARNSVLEGDLKKLKMHLKTLLDKADTDDRLIDGLKAEVSRVTILWVCGLIVTPFIGC